MSDLRLGDSNEAQRRLGVDDMRRSARNVLMSTVLRSGDTEDSIWDTAIALVWDRELERVEARAGVYVMVSPAGAYAAVAPASERVDAFVPRTFTSSTPASALAEAKAWCEETLHAVNEAVRSGWMVTRAAVEAIRQ